MANKFEYCCENCVFFDVDNLKSDPCEDCEQDNDCKPSHWLPKDFSTLNDAIEHECSKKPHNAKEAGEAIKSIMGIIVGREYDDPDHPEPDVKEDVVNHPKHYCRDGAMECFDEFVMIYGVEAAKHACLFNIHKYRYRTADKNGEEDMKKSDWYVRKYKELSEMG